MNNAVHYSRAQLVHDLYHGFVIVLEGRSFIETAIFKTASYSMEELICCICCIFSSLCSKDNSTLKHAMNDGKVNLLIVTSLKINTTVTVDVELLSFLVKTSASGTVPQHVPEL